jgi:hypothetical protein
MRDLSDRSFSLENFTSPGESICIFPFPGFVVPNLNCDLFNGSGIYTLIVPQSLYPPFLRLVDFNSQHCTESRRLFVINEIRTLLDSELNLVVDKVALL